MRKIRFYTSQLKEQLYKSLQESQAWAFNRIENSTERMGNLIDDLLLYSHVSHRPHQMEKIDLRKVDFIPMALDGIIKALRGVVTIKDVLYVVDRSMR